MKHRITGTFFLLILAISLFAQKKQVDLIVHNARIYTVDQKFSIVSAMAINKGKIEATGSYSQLVSRYEPAATLDGKGKFIYPGLIDAHTHFYHYGLGLQTANLVGTNSWQAILSKLIIFGKEHPDGWLIGRGWDQNDWEVKEFPDKQALDELFPDRPVLLTRVDGHAAIANQAALDKASLKSGYELTGGRVETKNGKLTGLLIDNAVGLVASKIPAPTIAQVKTALLTAQANCFAVGLTTVDECGLNMDQVLTIDSLQKTGDLKMRVYAMLSDAPGNFKAIFTRGPIKTDLLNVRSFKVYADGALGSRGAALLAPYSDKPDWSGFLLSSQAHFDSVARIINEKGFQMCTHAIGDSGNRTILNIYKRYLKPGNDKRWRIEHAQVVNEKDFGSFGKYAIIPSVQPTHATSDMYWATERLGKERIKGAYAYRKLLNQNGWIPLGTDFPVEDISPFKTFYAAVFRTDATGFPKGGYQMSDALTREQALRGMTIWAARSNFEEKEKGSIEKNKVADFVILDRDLMTAPANEILKTKVIATYSNGKAVYNSEN